MNTIKISRPIVVLQAGDPEKSVYTQHDKENQETGCPDRRATGIIKTRLSEFLRRVFIMSVYMQGIQDKRGSMPDRKICVRIPAMTSGARSNYPLSICEGHRSYCRSHR